jgi:exodeoxyribonuclease VII large subunit
MALKPISVSQLNDYLNRLITLDPLLSNITVRGEASGVKYHTSGHVYFSLVDEGSKVNCFLSRNNLSMVDFRLNDGMALVVNGSVSIYKQGGSYSIFVRGIEMEGEGALALAFERMKKKLSAEGLFDQSHKKPLPSFPKCVGVVTAETGAAIRDILKNITRKNNLVDVILYPSAVQGDGAAESIARAIRFANEQKPPADVLIVGRGGGSAEDLSAFNEECVARAIFDSQIPVISAVGHEVDFSISDLVADVRAETPTAGAQMAVPDTEELRDTIEALKEALSRNLENTMLFHRLKTTNLKESLEERIAHKLSDARNQAETCRMLLEENAPSKILESGYAIIEDTQGKVITRSKDITEGKSYKVTFASGYVYMEKSERGDRDE